MKKYTLLIITILISGIVFLINNGNKHQDQATYNLPPRPQNVDDRQWHRIKMRGGEIETDKILKGREIAERLFKTSGKKSTLKDAGLNNWSWKGPTNIAGRTRALIAKNTTPGNYRLILGAAAGGIWLSEDEGQNWTVVNDFLPSLAVTSFAMSSPNSNVIYASTGEGHASQTIGLPGAGIFKSVDGGLQWNQISSTADSSFYWVNKLAVDPTDDNHVFAVTSLIESKNGNGQIWGQILESTNGGTSWVVRKTATEPLTDIEIHPSDPTLIVASGHDKLYVYDGSQFRNKIRDMFAGNDIVGRVEIALAPSNNFFIYAQINTEDPTLNAVQYISTNRGSTWNYLGASSDVFSPNLGNYANTVWVNPLDESNVYFGGLDLFRMNNSGGLDRISSWPDYHKNGLDGNTPQLHADQHIILAHPGFSNSNKTVFIGNDGGVQKADDITIANAAVVGGGSGYSNLGLTTLGTTQFYSASASPVNGKIGGGTQDNSFISRNSNSNWFQHITGDGSMMLFHPTIANTIYANTNNNQLWKSTDGGVSYTSVANLGDTEAELIAPIALNPTSPNLVYLGGKALWQYDDNTGATTQLKSPFLGADIYITAIEVSDDGNQLWVGYDTGNVDWSTNGGSSWTQNIILEDRAITDIAINNSSFTESGIYEALISSGGYKGENITIFTHDPSQSFQFQYTWEDKSLNFEMQVNTVAYHPENKNWIYSGTDVGIFASEDKGNNWSTTPIYTSNDPLFSNEGPVYTEISELFWQYDGFTPGWNLGAATFGRGIFTSNAILDTIFVDQDYAGPFYFGSRSKPKSTFTSALQMAQNTGAVVHILSGGTHEEIGSQVLSSEGRVIISGSSKSSVIE